MATALAVSALIHGALVIVALETHLGSWGSGAASATAAANGAGSPLDADPGCLAEEALIAAARISVCLAPSGDNPDACIGQAMGRFELARLGCVSAAPPIELTMIETAPVPVAPEEKKNSLTEELEELEDDVEASQLQTVDLARPEVELEPDDARFSSEFNSRVEKESKRPTGAPQPIITQGVQSGQPQDSPEGRKGGMPGAPGAIGSKAPSAKSSARGGSSEVSSVGSTGALDGRDDSAPDGTMQRKGLGVSLDSQPGRGGGGELGDGTPHKAGKPNLRPSDEQVRGVAAGSYDSLDDIDEGEETLLNSKRFKYASFFNRVKRSVWENWHADRVYAMRDPDGKIYGVKNRQTIVKVSLDPQGRLANIMVEQPCGVDFLDDEAVSAFKKAQPFPHPPKGLVDKDSNLITFRFGFMLEIAERPSFRIVRYR